MKIHGEIAAIAVPAIVTNITTPLLSLADMAITGHIGETAYIAAIALGATLFNILYWVFIFLRMGTTGLTAQAFGKGVGQDLILWQSLSIGLCLGAVIVALGIPFCGDALALMDANDDAYAPALRYTKFLIFGAPAMLGTYATVGWLIGMQNTVATMIIAIATNLTNIALSTFLVFDLDMSIEGVAIGTVSAQWLGFALSLIIILRKYKPSRPITSALFSGNLKRFFILNVNIFLRTLCIVAVTLWFTHAGAVAGTNILAANALLMQLFMLFSFFMDGYAYAAEALSGKYLGRQAGNAIASVVHNLNIYGLICALIFLPVYYLFGEYILMFLTDEQAVINIAVSYLPWAAAIPICGFLAFVYDGVFVGLTRSRDMLISMVCAIFIFFAIYFSLHHIMANHALWLAFDAYLLARGVIEMLQYHLRKF